MTSTAIDTIEVPAAGTYRIEPGESTISFDTRHIFGLAAVRGTFALREGLVRVGDPVAGSTVRATIDAASIDTGLSMRDNTVRSKQYLETDRFPDIAFVSTGLSREDGGWVLRGELTVKDETHPLDVRVDEVRVVGARLQLRATSVVDRYAWGVTAMKGMTGRRLTFGLALVASQTGSIA